MALVRVADALRPGGAFYRWDAIWSFAAHDTLTQLLAWIERMAQPPGEGFTRADFETHVREEFSTFSWIIEGMIQRAGLTVEAARTRHRGRGRSSHASPGNNRTPDGIPCLGGPVGVEADPKRHNKIKTPTARHARRI
ncbi:MAG: hypothetical protein M3N57_10495 [Actinomycetota bacterium]|nr:hypothetical protein [Actinomycetota bacterium]